MELENTDNKRIALSDAEYDIEKQTTMIRNQMLFMNSFVPRTEDEELIRQMNRLNDSFDENNTKIKRLFRIIDNKENWEKGIDGDDSEQC